MRRTLIYSEKSEYKDFTPEKEIKNGEEYLNALDWALRNPDVKNIALSGPYGSGKSSIIQSYMQKHPSVKALNISLATFDVENCQDDENIIEEGILKQLFYKHHFTTFLQKKNNVQDTLVYNEFAKNTLQRKVIPYVKLIIQQKQPDW